MEVQQEEVLVMRLKNMVDFDRKKLVASRLSDFRFEDTYEVELLTGLFNFEVEDDLYRYDSKAEVIKIESNKLTFKVKR